jgi:hypothetical protein
MKTAELRESTALKVSEMAVAAQSQVAKETNCHTTLTLISYISY